MPKILHVLLAIGMVVGLFLLARQKPAWAANAEAGTQLSAQAQDDSPAPPGWNDECEKGNNKNKDKCKDKDKDKCKKHDDDCGSVKPPEDTIEACERGNYSVGGIATLDIKNLKGEGCLEAHTREPDPALDQIPDGNSILSDVIVLELPTRGAIANICFAVPPNTQGQIYASSQGSFQPVRTKVKNGVACADVSNPGDYALGGR